MILAWAALSAGMKIIWGVTLVASAIFLIQSIATFIGAGGSDIDTDIDFNGLDSDVPDAIAGGTDMNLYTFRNLINFLLGFGWSYIILQGTIQSTVLLVIVSVLIGLALVAAVMYLFKWLSGMQQTGNINIRQAAPGCKGKVYLTVPAARKGAGKVQITVNNAVREYAAITDGKELPTGTPIKVIEAIDADTLLVENIEASNE